MHRNPYYIGVRNLCANKNLIYCNRLNIILCVFTSTRVLERRMLFFYFLSTAVIIISDAYYIHIIIHIYVLWDRRGHGKTNLCLRGSVIILFLRIAGIYTSARKVSYSMYFVCTRGVHAWAIDAQIKTRKTIDDLRVVAVVRPRHLSGSGLVNTIISRRKNN